MIKGAEPILRTVDGDRLHGLAAEGSERRKELEVVIESPERAVGLHRFERHPQPEYPWPRPSIAGEIERTTYSLRSFCVAALDGDPAVLPPLFAPAELTLLCTETGAELMSLSEDLIAPGVQRGYLVRLRRRRRRLTEGQGFGDPGSRDTSCVGGAYAMHSLRRAYQALELLDKGTITLPIAEPSRSHLLQVRAGEVSRSQVVAELDELIRELEATPVETSDPPRELAVEQWLVRTYLEHWRDWKPIGLE